jgi:hypothetical protein
MTPEEVNQKVEFLIEYQAEFAIRQDRDHEMLVRGFETLRESSARFQTRLQKLLEHNRQKLRESKKLLRRQKRRLRKLRSLRPPNDKTP